VDLQRRYGAMIHRIAAAAFPEYAKPVGKRPEGGPIRVGIISSKLHDTHTIRKLFSAWAEGLKAAGFEIHVFYLGSESEENTGMMRHIADHFHDGRAENNKLIAEIAGRDLDAIIYTDIGMNARTQLFAGLRLAPLQCATWGHPITSGLATIDTFLTSELMEPEDGDEHCTETLVRLPNLSVCYLSPDMKDTAFPGHHGPRGKEPVFLCTQILFKILPRHDGLFASIAKRVGPCKFWFIGARSQSATNVFYDRLKRAFERAGLDATAYCRMYPELSQPEFLGLNLAADVLLDSLVWSGGNTTFEALACGKPVVTCPGPMMRGRHAYGILKRLGIEECIAGNEADYVEIAARLALDVDWRDEISARIKAGLPNIFDDPAPVQALAEYLKTACRGA